MIKKITADWWRALGNSEKLQYQEMALKVAIIQKLLFVVACAVWIEVP